MSLSNEIKSYLKKKKGLEQKVPDYSPPDTSKYSELIDTWEDFKYEWRKLFTAIKWLIIGISLAINLVSWSVYSSWNDFMGSREYKQYLLRVSK